MRLLGTALLRGLILLVLALALPAAAQTDDPRRAELRAGIASARAEATRLQGEFKGLLGVRDRAEGLIAEAKALRQEAEADRTRLQGQLAEIGRAAVPDAVGAEKRQAETELAQAEARLRQDGQALRAAEDLLNAVTEMRRSLFARRLLAVSPSPLSPGFWGELLDRAVPQVGDRLAELGKRVDENALDEDILGVVVLLLLALILYGISRAVGRRLARRWRRFTARAGIGPRRAAAVHALIDLGIAVAPVPAAIALLILLDDSLDFSPGSPDSLAVRVVGSAAGVLLGNGILRAMVAPRDPAVRLLAVDDGAARIVHRTGTAMLLVYAANLVFAEFTVTAHFAVVISEAATILAVLACCGLLAGALVRLAHAEPPDETPDMPAAAPAGMLGALAPLAWAVTVSAAACVLLGFTALGGFLIGRFIVTGVLVALGWIVLICVDTLPVGADDVVRSPRLAKLCRTFTIRPGTLALASIVVSGLLHALVVGAMAFVVIGPWNLAYGELNPFQDAFLGTTVADLRGWLGAAGLALLTFGAGVLATRLATGWLDRRFLPHTRLDAGARYSVITVVGYGGLALTLVTSLGQLGVNPQSLTVIAGALSVGIGFGLQSIVSNFVSGLIVLAERPVRVGDLVTVKGEEGRVKKISVRSTLIATSDRTDLVVPNTDLITSIVRNKTLTDDSLRLRVPLILDKETDIEVLHEILLKVAERHPNVAQSPAPTALLMRIGEHGLEYEVRCFLIDLAAGDATRSELNAVWLTLFRRAGIKLGGPPPA
ncbi:DUF3772 domain-containing protein [Methylobacterium nonmethylotrophicum]|uniref:DUF3772 domain-containing protein n=1 Tax=Methylobacterium nonmethylotrophicum TaxID=1141884 RepID=A0A4Z0NXK8_9HYPH|nr:DUF3772 domain-containing protein [Methylobacterium nonmethylotrophicum]TGE02407.1 DUF3772 domain-containing protein [Methylobacterium nonmethylotrophicum]